MLFVATNLKSVNPSLCVAAYETYAWRISGSHMAEATPIMVWY